MRHFSSQHLYCRFLDETSCTDSVVSSADGDIEFHSIVEGILHPGSAGQFVENSVKIVNGGASLLALRGNKGYTHLMTVLRALMLTVRPRNGHLPLCFRPTLCNRRNAGTDLVCLAKCDPGGTAPTAPCFLRLSHSLKTLVALSIRCDSECHVKRDFLLGREVVLLRRIVDDVDHVYTYDLA